MSPSRTSPELFADPIGPFPEIARLRAPQTEEPKESIWKKEISLGRKRSPKLETPVLDFDLAPAAEAVWARQPEPTVEPKYDTLAGLDGVWFWSDPIPVEKGKAYWLTLDVKGPTLVGDTLHVECEVLEHRLTSKGDRGLVRFANRVVNQEGKTVLEYNPLRMLKKK